MTKIRTKWVEWSNQLCLGALSKLSLNLKKTFKFYNTILSEALCIVRQNCLMKCLCFELENYISIKTIILKT